MMRTWFRRFCFLAVAFALGIGMPLPVDGMQCVDMMPQSALAASIDGSLCDDCECCGDENAVDTSTCVMGCGGIIATLPDAKVTAVMVSAVSFADTSHHHAGFSIAPDPSPPKFPS